MQREMEGRKGMSEYKMYIVLFPDHAMQPTRAKPQKRDFQKGSRLFEVDDNTPLIRLSEWYGLGFKSRFFKEIEDWE